MSVCSQQLELWNKHTLKCAFHTFCVLWPCYVKHNIFRELFRISGLGVGVWPLRCLCSVLECLGSILSCVHTLASGGDGSSNWVPVMHMGDLGSVPGSSLGPTLATMGIWGVNLLMGVLSLTCIYLFSLSLSAPQRKESKEKFRSVPTHSRPESVLWQVSWWFLCVFEDEKHYFLLYQPPSKLPVNRIERGFFPSLQSQFWGWNPVFLG